MLIVYNKSGHVGRVIRTAEVEGEVLYAILFGAHSVIDCGLWREGYPEGQRGVVDDVEH